MFFRCRFIKEFEHLPAGLRVNRRNEKNLKKDQGTIIDYSMPFEPSWIYKMLNGVRSDSFLIEGRQEDAEEFLLCLLNGLNDEMIEVIIFIFVYEQVGLIVNNVFVLVNEASEK